MRRPWKTITVLSGTALVVAVCWPRSEPEYSGKTLSIWLRGFTSEDMASRLQSAEALRHIGTNAVPPLIARLHQPSYREEPRWRQQLRALLSKQSFFKITIPRPSDTHIEALAALDALGPMARDAVPVLENLLNDKPPDHRALMVLARIGQEALPTLRRALTNDEKAIRLGARVCLSAQQGHSEFLFPKSVEDAEFMRRNCEFNAYVLRASFEEYRSQHPEEFSPDGKLRPVLPTDFNSPTTFETNVVLPVFQSSPGYE